MSVTIEEEDIPISFGYNQNAPHSMNSNRSMIDMKTIRQYKAEQARILEQFNTPYYSLLEFGAENMISFEHIGKVVMEILSGSFISDTIKSIKEFLHSNSSSTSSMEDDTVTVNKVDIIQKQLDAIVAQMEKVKEESRRKSEELEKLKRSVEERSLLSGNGVSEPIYTKTQYSNEDDDYVMDFSKPAGYKPPVEARSLFGEESSTVLRRRSLDPKPVNEVPKPPIPSVPPPRRSISRDSSRGPPQPRPQADTPMERQHNQLMEEIRKSATQRKMRISEEEKQVSREELETIVKGSKDESKITKEQRQLKMSLNDEIRMKMQERLRIMRDSDSEDETNVNEMD